MLIVNPLGILSDGYNVLILMLHLLANIMESVDREDILADNVSVNNQTTDASNTCQICYKSFSTKGYLKQHGNIHGGFKMFPCSLCKKTFSTASYLKRHKLVQAMAYNVSPRASTAFIPDKINITNLVSCNFLGARTQVAAPATASNFFIKSYFSLLFLCFIDSIFICFINSSSFSY